MKIFIIKNYTAIVDFQDILIENSYVKNNIAL